MTAKVVLGLIVGIICFYYLESKYPSEDRKKELLILLGSTLVGIGMDSIVILMEKYHYVCYDP